MALVAQYRPGAHLSERHSLPERQRRHTRYLLLVEGGDGQGEDDARASLGRILGVYSAAVRFDDAAHDGKPQSAAAGGNLARIIGAVEAVEDARQSLRWDAFAAIGDSDLYHSTLLARFDGDGA